MTGPWDQAKAPAPALADAPHEAIIAARVNGTDFLAAQRDNRVKTWVLILVLINLGFLLGYVLGWALEAWGTDANRFQLAAVSSLGLLGGALLAGIGVVSAGVTLAFGDKLVLSMNGAREVTPEAEPRLHNVVEDNPSEDQDYETHKLIGRGNKDDLGTHWGWSSSLQCQLRDKPGLSARDQKERLIGARLSAQPHMLRNPFGDMALVNFGLISFTRIPGVASIRSSFALKQVLYTTAVPLA